MERQKVYNNFVVCIVLKNGGYHMRHMKALEFKQLKAYPYNGAKYYIDEARIWNLHGWYPWMPENPWNAWRMVYNMFYRWWYACGYIEFREKEAVLDAKV